MKLMLIWFVWFMWYMSSLVLKPKKLSNERIKKNEEQRGRYNPDIYESACKLRFILNSDFGYTISCECLEICEKAEDLIGKDKMNEDKGIKKVAILCHGFSYSKHSSLKYAEIFLEMGYVVIIFDHRNHGMSGKAFTSMGFYEKYDLKKVVDWCVEAYGRDCNIITHGESMGAATVLLHLEIDDRVKGVIADCAYSDLRQLLCYQLKRYYHLPRFLIPVESLLTFMRAGFWYKEVSPIKAVSSAKLPILFIHGKEDFFVPTKMSKQMYECKSGRKAIYLVAKAKHAESFYLNKQGYIDKVRNFLEKII